MRLIYVRHGEPDYVNDCLTETGRAQAAMTAKRLSKEKIDAIFSSPMGRAVETATYTAKEQGLEVNKLDFMHEIVWGDRGSSNDYHSENLPYDGHPWTLAYSLISENPEYARGDAWKQHHFFKDNKCMDYMDKIADGIDELLRQYGIERKNGLYYCKEKNDSTIALFAHGGSGAIMYTHILNLPFTYVLTSMTYGVCSVSVIDFECEDSDVIIPRIELFNDMRHLGNVKKESFHFEM